MSNNDLTANNNHFYFDYHDGKYGYNTSDERGADTFFPFSNGGTKLVGTYSSNTTVDVSAYGATSASQFLAVITSSSGSSASGYTQGIPSNGYFTISSSVTMPSLSLNGNSLTVTVGYNTFSVSGVVNRTDSANNTIKIYYVGDIE